MKKRMKVSPRKDRQIFRRTATKVKAINLPNKTFRGGIRL